MGADLTSALRRDPHDGHGLHKQTVTNLLDDVEEQLEVEQADGHRRECGHSPEDAANQARPTKLAPLSEFTQPATA